MRKNALWFIFVFAVSIVGVFLSNAAAQVARVSVDSGGTEADAGSWAPCISSDGRYVVFESDATNLVGAGVDTNGKSDVFIHDRETGATSRVSVAFDSSQGNNSSWVSTISANNRYVAFCSRATNLVGGGTTGDEIFRKDLQTGEVLLVSADAAGTEGDASSWNPSISADGRYVAFYSNSTNLVAGGTTGYQVFRKDLQTGEVKLVSADAAGTQGNNSSSNPSMTPDGRYVAFQSGATNLVAGGTSNDQVFRKDLQTGAILLVSADAGGTEGNSNSSKPAISSDGRYVAFEADSTNLVAGGTSNDEVFRKDLQAGEVKLVSANASGTESDDHSLKPSISSDGRYVAFRSWATNLVSGVTVVFNIYRKDLQTGEIKLASADLNGTPADLESGNPSLSSDGRYMAFDSNATNLVTGDGNATTDIFVHVWPAVTGINPSSGSDGGGTPVTISGKNFAPGATASFGGSAATGVTVVNDTTITCTTPAHGSGLVDVAVTNQDGLVDTLSSSYTYIASGPTPPSDQDGDGLPDDRELGPSGNDPNYDGNGDGIPDWRQSNVSSFPTYTDDGTHYVTLAVPSGERVFDLQAIRTVPAPLPAGASLPYGYVTFKVGGVSSGGCTTVTMYLDGAAPATYYKYGPTPDNPTAHWYDFSYDGETGAEIAGNTIILHLCDGKRGDHDLTANGQIVDPGGPAAIAVRPVLYFPYLVNGSGEQTELGIINKEGYEVSGTIQYFGTAGTAAGSRVLSLAGRGKVEIGAGEVPAAAVSAVVSADGQVAGYGRLLSSSGQRCAVSGIRRLAQSITIPFTTSSASWMSGVAVLNPGDEEVTITLEDVSQGGGSVVVGPKAQELLWLRGTPDRISATGAVAVVEVIESVGAGGDLGAVALGEVNRTELYVPSLLFGSGNFSGVGVRNSGVHEGTMTAWGYDALGNVEELSLGMVSGRSQVGVTLTSILGTDTVWAKVGGELSTSTPFGTPALPLQGLAVYGQENSQAVGAINLNSLKFRSGIVGVVDEAVSPMVAVLNPGTAVAQLTVTTYGFAGEVLEESEQAIGAGEVVEMMFLNSAAAYVELESEVDLYGVEMIREDGRMEMLPALQ